MSPSATAPPSVMRGRQAEQWELDAAARSQVADLLRDLPPGFVVFHDIELPKPTRGMVDHLVIGPRNVWAVTTHVLAEPVTYGRGRNADTLWSGRTPLRTMLEAADWESSAIGELIGFDVEPVLCLVAPCLPQSAFDFHGIRISEPAALVRQVATSTADFVDVERVAEAVRRALGTLPSDGAKVPRLGTPVMPVARWSPTPRRRRTLGARLHAVRSMPAVRVGSLIALAAVALAMLPTVVDTWNSIATEGADRLTDVIEERTAADDTTAANGPVDGPMPVGYDVTCPVPGAGWMIEWSWPGELPPGVDGYVIHTMTNDAPRITHTLTPWTDPTASPPAIRLPDAATITILTDHRSDDGRVLATASEVVSVPATGC